MNDEKPRGKHNKRPKREDLSAAKAVQEAERKAAVLEKYGGDLDDIDRALIHFRYAYPGIQHEELADLVGLAPLTVTRRLNKESWKKAWAELMLPANQLLDKSEGRLLRQYMELAECDDLHVRERVLRTLLVSQGIIKNKFDIKADGFEPLVLITSQQQIVVTRPGAEKVASAPVQTEQIADGTKTT